MTLTGAAPVTPRSLAARVARLIPRMRNRTNSRLRVLLTALEQHPVGSDVSVKQLLVRLESQLSGVEPDRMWLALAVLRAEFPVTDEMTEAIRVARLDGPLAPLAHLIAPHLGLHVLRGVIYREVEVVTGAVFVDLQETSQSTFSTGIQRVARQTARRWALEHDVLLVGWNPGQVGLRRLRQAEVQRAMTETGLVAVPGEVDPDAPDRVRLVVPWKSTYLLPELTLQPTPLQRLAALSRFSGNRTAVIGFDCVPVTSAETVDFGVAGGFAGNLSSIKFFGRVAAISDAAADEYSGWRDMLQGSGIPGPAVAAIELPVEAEEPTATDIERVRTIIGVGESPIVLCVGSHEPRKNHLALLQAAELAWRAGAEFSLVFIGGNSWRSQGFENRVAELRAAGHIVQAFTAMPDELLWAAYRVAHVVAFPSLNEGYGLPIAEALALGTPILTSDYGSMAQIARQGGAVLVDPRNDDSIADGLVAVLGDEELYARLRAEAASRTLRTWDDYASETWEFLTSDR